METPQPSNETLVETTNDVSPRTVRTNWLRFSWSQISGATKVLLMISMTLAIIQISATVVILALGRYNGITCEKPLQLYLIVFVVRVGLSLPLSIYQHLFVPRGGGIFRGRRGYRNRNNNNNNTTVTPQSSSSSAPAPAVITEQSNETENNTGSDNIDIHQPQPQGEQEQRPSTLLNGWADRLKSLLDLFAILWFIVGNYLVFSSSSCSVTAAPYYYTILTWVLFGYTILLIPLLACTSVIFCLPCVLVAMRAFNINVSNVMVGGTKEEILRIPVFKYKAPPSDELQQQYEQQQIEETVINTTSKNELATMKKANYIRRFMKRHQKKENNSIINKYLTIPKAEDAVCSICLSEYENNELVCKLWCGHHYHQECVAEWLALNRKCPLCKRDFRGKNYVSNDSDDEEEAI